MDDPDAAHFKLLAQVLSVSKTSQTAAESALNAGYGGVLSGIVGGGVVGAAMGGSREAVIGAGVGGIVGGLVSTVANAAVKDVFYVAIMDIQISEKAGEGGPGNAICTWMRVRELAGQIRQRSRKRPMRSATGPGW